MTAVYADDGAGDFTRSQRQRRDGALLRLTRIECIVGARWQQCAARVDPHTHTHTRTHTHTHELTPEIDNV